MTADAARDEQLALAPCLHRVDVTSTECHLPAPTGQGRAGRQNRGLGKGLLSERPRCRPGPGSRGSQDQSLIRHCSSASFSFCFSEDWVPRVLRGSFPQRGVRDRVRRTCVSSKARVAYPRLLSFVQGTRSPCQLIEHSEIFKADLDSLKLRRACLHGAALLHATARPELLSRTEPPTRTDSAAAMVPLLPRSN